MNHNTNKSLLTQEKLTRQLLQVTVAMPPNHKKEQIAANPTNVIYKPNPHRPR
jgi:hypothetical protein